MSRCSHVKLYQNKKESLQERCVNHIQIYQKNKMIKDNKIALKGTKFFQKMKSKGWLSTEKIIMKL